LTSGERISDLGRQPAGARHSARGRSWFPRSGGLGDAVGGRQLIEGPLWLLDGDYPERELMLAIAASAVDRVLAAARR
jgi:hypothetical protein